MIKINAEKVKELFEDADRRIEFIKDDRARASDSKRKIFTNTELIAKSIAELAYDTLLNATESEGIIEIPKHMRKQIGKAGKGTSATPGSTYKIDDSGLRMVLDYSSEDFGFIKLRGGKSFIKYTLGRDKAYNINGEEISLVYLRDILACYGMNFNRCCGLAATNNTLIPVELFYINVPIGKDKDDEEVEMEDMPKTYVWK